jgi:hypothetical protein
MALLTSRTLAQSTAITPTTLIHIVTTGDTSQNPQGSSYKAELQQLTPIFGGYTYEIGEYVPSEGGVIFHRYKDGGQERYLVVDTTDLGNSVLDIELVLPPFPIGYVGDLSFTQSSTTGNGSEFEIDVFFNFEGDFTGYNITNFGKNYQIGDTIITSDEGWGYLTLTVKYVGSIWSNITDQLPGASSSWDGLSNSNAIVSQSGHTSSAALLCLDSTNGSKSDWYLPAIDELSLLLQNRFNVNKTLSTIEGATVIKTNLPLGGVNRNENSYYWSSSEFGFFNNRLDQVLLITAFYINTTRGDFEYNAPIENYFVRAVRKI